MAPTADAATTTSAPRPPRQKSSGSLSLLATFRYWSKVPVFGSWIFGWLLMFASPYTGTLSLSVKALSPGQCTTSMREWWLLRNPFRSIHAAALLNMGEATGGLAVVAWCEAQSIPHRAIVKRLEIEFYKKARGVVTARCRLDTPSLLPAGTLKTDTRVNTDIFDASGSLVAQVKALWAVEQVSAEKLD